MPTKTESVDPAVVNEVKEALIDIKAEQMTASVYDKMVDGGTDLPEGEGDLNVTSTGHVTLYRTETGRPATILYDQIRPALRKKILVGPNRGKPVFVESPPIKYTVPNLVCFLHPEYEDRKTVEALGIGHIYCPKKTLATEFDRRTHAAHRHKSEWAVYQDFKSEEKSKRVESLQEAQLEATRRLLESNVK